MKLFFIMLIMNMSLQLFSSKPTVYSDKTSPTPRILLKYDDRYLKIEVLSDELIHFETAFGSAPRVDTPIYTTPMVARRDFLGPKEFQQNENGFETATTRVIFEYATLCVTSFDKARNFLIGTVCPFNLDQAEKGLYFNTPLVKNLYGLGQFFTNPQTSDGDLVGRVWDPLPDSFGHRLTAFSDGASTRSLFPIIYALGPTRENFAIFVDNIYRQKWTMDQNPWQGQWQVQMWGDQLRWYVISGDSLPSLRRSYMDLSGRPLVPPKRVLGLWVSEFGFDSWDELKQKLYSLVSKNFPLEGFALDIQWFGGKFYENGADTHDSRMGSLEFDQVAFPNAANQITQLRRDFGVELMLIEESYVSQFLNIHDRMSQNGFLAQKSDNQPVFLNSNPWWGVGGMIDWTNDHGADFWHDEKRQKLIDLGINFHWADLGEPEMYDPNAYYFGFPELGKNRHADIHNIYAFKWLESIERGYKRNNVNSRPYVMSRAGTSGIQRFGGMWSGDLGANMGSLRAHLNAAMHMSLSGIDYYSSDIGGFHRKSYLIDQDELYTQWFANAALFDLPVRPHAWNIANNIETSPSLIGDTQSNLANIRLRYSLTPYYYSLMHHAHDKGEPIIAPLVYYFQDAQEVRTMGHERMIGPSLLAAVVAQYGEHSRRVYLPRGRWYDYHLEGQRYDSLGEYSEALATMHDGIFRLPLFARAGAIIPLMHVDDKTMNVLGRRRDNNLSSKLILAIFASQTASTFELIEDDGITNAYEGGARSFTKISQITNNNKAIINIDAAVGSFDGFEAQRPIMIEYYCWLKDDCGKVSKITLNNAELSPCTNENPNHSCWALSAPGKLRVELIAQPTNIDQEIIINWGR